LFIVVSLIMWTSAAAEDSENRAYKIRDNKGAVHDLCLDNLIPVYIKKKGNSLYFVRVDKRYTGEVRAGSYGEARDIACAKKTNLILYNSEP